MNELTNSNREIIFETGQARLIQCDDSERYILHFHGEELSFRACELIAFKRKIQRIDMVSLLASDTPDVEIVQMPHCDRLFVLAIHDVLELKELFSGAFTMLELNSMIHRELKRKVF